MLLIPEALLERIVAHCLDSYPTEACGLLGGVERDGGASVVAVYPTENLAGSARVYEVPPRDLLRYDREAEAAGAPLLGVYHSHTHTEAKPSATDVGQAPDPEWHYVLVSLRDVHPSVRSWRLRGGKAEEERVVLQW